MSLIARAQQAIRHPDKAVAYLRRQIKGRLLSFYFPLERARMLCANGQHQQAEQLCVQLAAQPALKADAQALLAYIYQQTGRYDLAIDTARQALGLQPGKPELLLTLVHSLRASGQSASALEEAERLFRLQPVPAHAVVLLEIIAKVQGAEKFTQRLTQLRKGIPALGLPAKLLFENGLTPGNADAEGLRGYPLRSMRSWAEQKGYPVLSLEGPEEIPVALPPIIGPEGATPAGPVQITLGNPAYVAELRDVTVFSKSGVLLTADGTALNDPATHPRFGDQLSFQYDKAVVARRGSELLMNHTRYTVANSAAGIFMSGLATEAYGHWIPEYLTKLAGYVQHPDFAKLPLVVDEQMPQSHRDYLRALVPNDMIVIPTGGALRFERLLVAPTPSFYPVDLIENHSVPQNDIAPLSPRALAFMAQRLASAPAAPSPYGPKIYLSRRNMQWRRLLNDQEIATYLASKGYAIVDVEKLTFAEQLGLYRQATHIVAPNGSSLLNTLFSPRDVRMYVLSQPSLHNWAGFYGPMRALGYQNIVFIAGDQNYANKHADYAVPLARLAEALGEGSST